MQVNAVSYGAFPSPISAEVVAKGGVSIRQVHVEGDEIYWLESRPLEKGRTVAVKFLGKKEILPSPYNIRTMVHEYGGKCSTLHEGTLYFSNHPDQALYKLSPNGSISRITNNSSYRFADFVMHPNGKWLYSVMEDHTNEKDVKNSIVKVDTEKGSVEKVASGHDFYAAPRLSPNGKHLAYLFWDHPNMPWDETTLWISDLDAYGLIESERKITGIKNESVLEPLWSPEGILYFVSDRNGYWNIYDEENDPLHEMNADFTTPPWGLGNKSFTFVSIQGMPHIAAVYTEKGVDSLCLIDLEKHTFKKVSLPFTNFSDVTTRKNRILFLAKSPTQLQQLYEFDPISNQVISLVEPNPLTIDPQFFSTSELIEFPSLHEKTAFAFFYPPKNPSCTANKDEKPPLIVFTHGGPTAHVSPSLKLSIQFWTSRGFAVCDVNYGGSSGHGKEYRDRLKERWGIVDVYDVASVATHLAKQGLVDPNRLAIEGGSAGGYTTLAALTFTNVFKVGASYFGVSDLALLVQDTHKFEAHYLDSLIGPYPAKEALYKERSPLYHTENLSCPVLFLQGGLDKVVLPNQAEKMYNALLKKQIPTAYILFPDEAHGFKSAPNIIASFEAELYFYQRIFKIPLSEKAYPLAISNLPGTLH